MEPNDIEPIPDDSIFQINEELFYRERLPKMSARELFDRIHRLFPDHCESVTMLRRLMGEAYRRLNEADALRKENAVIRADNADLLAKQDAFVFVHNNMTSDMDALRKENEELRKDKERLDCLESLCPNGNVGDIRCFGTWRMAIDDAARLAKESEASYE